MFKSHVRLSGVYLDWQGVSGFNAFFCLFLNLNFKELELIFEIAKYIFDVIT